MLSRWDNQIQFNRTALTNLQVRFPFVRLVLHTALRTSHAFFSQKLLTRVGSTQARLERHLDILEVHQNEVACALDGIELDVEQLKRCWDAPVQSINYISSVSIHKIDAIL